MYSFHISSIDAGWRDKDTYTCLYQKVKVTTEPSQYFDSDTITWVVFNRQLSYFIHTCRFNIVTKDTYTVWDQKVKGQGHNWTLSILWLWHDNLRYCQCTALIIHPLKQDGETNIPIYVGINGQGYSWTQSILWFWHDNMCSFQRTAFIFHT